MHFVDHKHIRLFAFDPDSLRAEELNFLITPTKIRNLCRERAYIDSFPTVFKEAVDLLKHFYKFKQMLKHMHYMNEILTYILLWRLN